MATRLIRKTTRPEKATLLPPEHRTEQKRISASNLIIDPAVQREEKPGHVKFLTDNWRNSLCGPLDVSARRQKSGRYKYAILDGRHRFEGGKANGITQFDCIVHYDLTTEEEASFHLWQQSNRKDDHAVDKWKLKIAAGSEPHVEAEKILSDRGLVVSTSPGTNSIACPGALTYVVENYDPAVLGDAIDAIEAAYGRDKTSWINNLIRGFAEVLGTQPGVADSPAALGRKVAKQYPAPENLVQAARADQKSQAGGGGEGLSARTAVLIAQAWNSRRRGTKYEFATPRLVTRDEILSDEDYYDE